VAGFYQDALVKHLDRRHPVAAKKVAEYCQHLDLELKNMKGKTLDDKYLQLRLVLLNHLRATFGVALQGSAAFSTSPRRANMGHRESYQEVVRSGMAGALGIFSFLPVMFSFIANLFSFLNVFTIILSVGTWTLFRPIVRADMYHRTVSILSIGAEAILVYDRLLWYDSEQITQLEIDLAENAIQQLEPSISEFVAKSPLLSSGIRKLPSREAAADVVRHTVEQFRQRPQGDNDGSTIDWEDGVEDGRTDGCNNTYLL
jgi:hypothetical protein